MSSPFDPEVREAIRLRLWDAVDELADKEHQQATWGRVDNPHFTFVECCECFFGCIGDGVADAMTLGLITSDEARLLAPLWDAIEAYNSPNGNNFDNAAVLADPGWQAVVDLADSCRIALLSFLPDDEARRLAAGRDSMGRGAR